MTGSYCFVSWLNSNWLLDSGASDHISCNLNLFHSYKRVSHSGSFITIPDGRKIEVLYIGSVVLNDQITLHDVLYAPNFHFNLISIHKLYKDMQCQISFTHDKCYLKGLSKKGPSMLLGRLEDGLYNITEQIVDKEQHISGIETTACMSIIDSNKL
ncbi:Retrovirus-related Pol polyprotein from transposon RE1 [Bienertia sinuspersici]